MQWMFTKVLKDNYVWCLYNNNREAIVIDCGDYDKISEFVTQQQLVVKYILITHAHADHISGIDELRELTKAKVIGNKNFLDRLPKVDIEVTDGDTLNILNTDIEVIATPGHCADHLSFYFPNEGFLFCGDFIFSLGCGRIFEGTPNDMLSSLSKIKKLPSEILLFPSHEYTKSNLAFTKSLNFFDLGEREHFIMTNEITLPTTLKFEFQCNPFLNINNLAFKEAIMHNQTVDEVTFFMHLRELKNQITKLTGG